MGSINEQQDPLDTSSYRELRALIEVESNPDMTQRDLSRRLKIALGLTNVLLRNMVQKGYVRAIKAGWKRWLYALTPEGFSRKLQLSIAYMTRVLDHYQRVRSTLREQLDPLALNAESRVAIYGTGEFAELVYLGLKDIGIEEIDVFSPAPIGSEKFLGMPVRDIRGLQANGYDRIVIGDLHPSASVYSELDQLDLKPAQVVTFFTDGTGREGK